MIVSASLIIISDTIPTEITHADYHLVGVSGQYLKSNSVVPDLRTDLKPFSHNKLHVTYEPRT